ncbi:MAG TPA: hypothetical protein VEO19_14245 [Terriglobia bacterium]|nr:hypothetical protein [Terriglobia bacterium]
MKKFTLLILVMLVAAGMALAQSNPSGTPPVYSGTAPAPGALPYGTSNAGFNAALGADVLGAHNCYGRGCVACHAPHGGALGNNAPTGTGAITGVAPNGGAAASSDTYNNGVIDLWGENLAPYYGATVQFVGGAFPSVVTLPTPTSTTAVSGSDGATIILLCLSCHDGALTRPAMMAGTTVEALPIVGGSAPTLFGLTTGNSALKYVNEHPVGGSVGCGSHGPSWWDCTSGGGAGTSTATSTDIVMSGDMITFATTDYPASIWNAYATAGGAAGDAGYPLASFSQTYTVNGVTCTTCHNQHSMTVYSNTSGASGATAYFPTMFFVKGEYMPSTGGNSVAQFCRNCHGALSNEYVKLTVPTT